MTEGRRNDEVSEEIGSPVAAALYIRVTYERNAGRRSLQKLISEPFVRARREVQLIAATELRQGVFIIMQQPESQPDFAFTSGGLSDLRILKSDDT